AQTLASRISAIVADSSFAGSGTSITVFDDTRHRLIYLHHGGTALKPASNMKLTTTAAALGRLGASTQLRTRVLIDGTVTGGTLRGSLFLVGGGDPSLSTGTYSANRFGGISARVGSLADRVRAAGITHVTGRVFGDESGFDRARTAPYWRPIYWMDCP